jgi:hypothetical protein
VRRILYHDQSLDHSCLERADMKPILNTILLFTAFLIGVFVFIGARDPNLQHEPLKPALLDQPNGAYTANTSQICNLPTCLRISAGALSEQVQTIFEGLSQGLSGYDPAYFGGEGTMSFDIRPTTFLSGILFRIISLLPIIFVATLLFSTFWSQLTFLILTFLSLAGWGPWLYVSWYKFIGQFVDWPKAWWDFRQPVAIYDYGAIGFVFLLLLYLCIRKSIRYWEVAAFTVFGQSIFEHLGLVTGVSVFMFELLRGETVSLGQRFKKATAYLFVCGIVSILFLVGLSWAVIPEVGGPANFSAIQLAIDYLEGFWSTYGSKNFSAIDILAANFFSLLWPPLIAGGLLAGLMTITEGSSKIGGDQIRRRAAAGAATVIGFSSALFVGIFVSGYHSEAGRQLLPLISILIFTAAYQCYCFLIKIGMGQRPL